MATNALPLIRQHALEAYLSRTLRSIDAGGLLDPRTGLLTPRRIQPRFRDRRLSDAVARRRTVGGALCFRSGASARATRRRADHRAA